MNLKITYSVLVVVVSGVLFGCVKQSDLPSKKQTSNHKTDSTTQQYVASAQELTIQFHGCKAHH